jgi:hypothetical protein
LVPDSVKASTIVKARGEVEESDNIGDKRENSAEAVR